MRITGKAWKFGDDIDTDQIIPAKYLTISDPVEISKHCFQYKRDNFASLVTEGDLIIAGNNFGCGSSREEAPFILKEIGIRAVIAKSFARIFFRNAINIGLPVIEAERIVDETSEGDILNLNLINGQIKNASKNLDYTITPVPEFLQQLINQGGLVNFVKRELGK